VRELRNIIETVVTLEQGARITREMLDRYLPQPTEEFDSPLTTALVRVNDTPRSAPAMDADMAMLYRTLLQLSADVAEMKSVLRHLLSMSVDLQEPSPTDIRPAAVTPPTDVPVDDLQLANLERRAIETALRRTQGNRREAAKLLGLSERTLYRKIDDYGLL
jgi:DNA-binding NtrC family response regulator